MWAAATLSAGRICSKSAYVRLATRRSGGLGHVTSAKLVAELLGQCGTVELSLAHFVGEA